MRPLPYRGSCAAAHRFPYSGDGRKAAWKLGTIGYANLVGPVKTLSEFRGWAATAPPGTMLSVEGLSKVLKGLEAHRPHIESTELDPDSPMRRVFLWSVGPETRIGRGELLEAIGRSASWLHRHTGPTAPDRIPHRRFDGQLVFVVGEVRRWLGEREMIEVAGPRELAPQLHRARRRPRHSQRLSYGDRRSVRSTLGMNQPLLFRWRRALASPSGPAPTTRHVLLTLSLAANTDGGSCYPSTRTLATSTGLSRRCVMEHLRIAENEGWLDRRQRGGGQGWRRTEYTLVLPTNLGAEGDRVRGDGELPRADVGGNPEARRGNPESVEVVTQDALTSPVTSPVTSPHDHELRDRFERLWLVHRRGSRDGAWRQYLDAVPTRVDADTIHDARVLHVEAASEPKYIKSLEGWIRDGRWEEDQTSHADPYWNYDPAAMMRDMV